MSYFLGVDLGTTYTAAAIVRDGRAEMTPLGDQEAAVPSVLALSRDGGLLVGEAAQRRAATHPATIAREFKRRLGDPVPMLVDGVPYSAHALTAKLLRWVVDQVSEREGEAPAVVAVTYPANWGPHRRELLINAVAQAGLDGAVLVTEPEAAAVRYASTERVEPGSVVAVYDLGGGTFDAAVLRRTDVGYEVLGEPAGLEQLGGLDIDEAVFAHVRAAIGRHPLDIDLDDAAAVAALVTLRRECTQAKESLSHDTETVIPVILPGVHTLVRLTRAELEDLVRPMLLESVAAFRRAVASSGVDVAQLTTVLLAGGSSRIPLVGQLLSTELGRPVAVDAHPKHIVALGAALCAAPTPVAPPREHPFPDAHERGGSGRGGNSGRGGGSGRGPRNAERPGQGRTRDRQDGGRKDPSDPSGRGRDTRPQPPGGNDRQRTAPRPTGSQRPQDAPAARRRRQRWWIAASVLGLLTVTLAGTGFGTGSSGGSLPTGAVVINGVDASKASQLRVDLSAHIPVTGTTKNTVTMPLTVFGQQFDSNVARSGGSLSLSNVRYLAAGPVRATIRSGTGERHLVVVPTGARLVSVPTAGALILLLFCLANAESLLKPIRRGRRGGPGTTVAMGLLGAGTGIALTTFGWALTNTHLVTNPLLIVNALCGLGAALAVTLALNDLHAPVVGDGD